MVTVMAGECQCGNVSRITIVILFVVLKRKKAKHNNQMECKFLVREPI